MITIPNIMSVRKIRPFFIPGIFLLLSLLAFIYIVWWQSTPPKPFPEGIVVSVEKNSSARSVARELKAKGVVKNQSLLSLGLLVFGGGHRVLAGDYLFGVPESSWTVAKRLVTGEQGLERVKVTFPEGATVEEVGLIISKKIPDFDYKKFISEVSVFEGYLFPETYYFLPNVTIEEVVDTMSEEFDDKLTAAKDAISDFGKSLNDIIIMASILEEEAKTMESKRVIAGILWKRIDKGMPLQVDAPFAYVNGKSTYELTREDLAADSPYNTYKYKGLPAGPISNPGLESIIAAVTPVATNYWYYLNDYDGAIHYAVNYDDHLANKAKYVK